MRTLPYRVVNERVYVHVIETDDDVHEASSFVLQQREDHSLAIDTETTGLEIFSPTFRIRTLQLGDAYNAYVLPLRSSRDRRARRLLTESLHNGVTIHNAPYDLLAMDATGLFSMDELHPHVHDTQLMAHLLDPRGKMDGGIGFGLKNLSAAWVDEHAPDTQNDLKDVFHAHGYTLSNGWANIPIDNETYLLYAGLDCILLSRLYSILRARINQFGYGSLAHFDQQFQQVAARMQRRGFRIDVPYTQQLISDLSLKQQQGIARARELGVENINSTRQVATALQNMNWAPSEFTKSGQPKVDKAVLEEIERSYTHRPDMQDLVRSITSAKRAGKWSTAYAEAMLNARDPHDHVHASINTLAARTSRMSISNPPLQQLPSRGDDAWIIRRCVIADEGKLIVSADLDQVEFRILAALANISAMKHAIEIGEDLHDFTARLIYGEGFTKGQRKVLKGAGFGKVFGGGAVTIARQTGAPVEAVREAIREYDRLYHELPTYQRSLQAQARANGGAIHSYYGRYAPLDPHREYAAVNYSVQGPAADWLKRGIMEMVNKHDLDDHLLLPVHDEVVGQADRNDAREVAHLIGVSLSGELEGVRISASGEVYGKSWADGYIERLEDGTVINRDSGNIISDWKDVT